jgi:hypothetical protein
MRTYSLCHKSLRVGNESLIFFPNLCFTFFHTYYSTHPIAIKKP